MPKLHETLAVLDSLKGQAEKTRADLASTFDKRPHHFSKTVQVFKPLNETEKEITEQQLNMQTTVPKELAWISEYINKALDANYQVADANMKAKADIVLEDGSVLVKDAPATFLMVLSKDLRSVQELIKQIPTLDPSKGFEPDPAEGIGAYRARDIIKQRTKKVNKAFELSPATDKHPAQVEKVIEDVVIGNILQSEWSGLITPSRKSILLNRIEELIRSVAKAKSRANEQEVDTNLAIGKKLLDYVLA